MGQYYRFIILADAKKNNREIILLYINPHDYNSGAKLMEHSYLDNHITNTVEFLISKRGQFYKSRIVWAGDYADQEPDNSDCLEYSDNSEDTDDYEEYNNLYSLTKYYSPFTTAYIKTDNNYIVNHTKKLYVDKTKSNQNHPLPLLISEGNGKGGGDYSGNNEELCGTWSRDVISMEETIPKGYQELVCAFEEY